MSFPHKKTVKKRFLFIPYEEEVLDEWEDLGEVEDVGSFLFICDVFGFNPDVIREGIKAHMLPEVVG